MVPVSNTRLSVLDWGGSGPLLVFMPGYGDSAHIFDDLAPAFRHDFHVVGITPRGFPPSGAPDSGYTIAQLAEDAAAVMDYYGAHNAILAGHSISGAVITQFGVTHPDRLTAAIYLDASFDFGPAFRRSHRPGRPTLPADVTGRAYRAWQARYSDSLLSPGVLAAARNEERVMQIDSLEAPRRRALVAPLADEVRSHPHEPWRITAPALAICAAASFDRVFGWLTPDSSRWNAAHEFYDAVTKESRDERERYARLDEHATIIEVDSGHYIFMDARDQVVRLMRDFLRRFARMR
jgi:pimeloyl-ACP methyl ester carboxylesterase